MLRAKLTCSCECFFRALQRCEIAGFLPALGVDAAGPSRLASSTHTRLERERYLARGGPTQQAATADVTTLSASIAQPNKSIARRASAKPSLLSERWPPGLLASHTSIHMRVVQNL